MTMQKYFSSNYKWDQSFFAVCMQYWCSVVCIQDQLVVVLPPLFNYCARTCINMFGLWMCFGIFSLSALGQSWLQSRDGTMVHCQLRICSLSSYTEGTTQPSSRSAVRPAQLPLISHRGVERRAAPWMERAGDEASRCCGQPGKGEVTRSF